MSKAIRREEDLFHAALKIEAQAEWIKLLERECTGDAGLKRRVFQLIEANDAADRFFILAAESASRTDKPQSRYGKW